MEANSDKLDLYSIPVFLFEVIILSALTFAAYHIHFQYHHAPYVSGFYCDDISLRHEYSESKLTQQFTQPDNELTVLALLLAVPIIVIIFCELVNSMFGSLKFRKVRSLCRCCKLHSITRRTVRFVGAYAFGFLIVVISCNIIASTAGRPKPYFAQECPQAFRECGALQQPQAAGTLLPNPSTRAPSFRPVPTDRPGEPLMGSGSGSQGAESVFEPPLSQPIINESNGSGSPLPLAALVSPQAAKLVRHKRQAGPTSAPPSPLAVRQWIVLDQANLAGLCQFAGDSIQERKFDQLFMSWPSFPAAIITYACLFVATYLSFVGTARPFRLLTSVLILLLLLMALLFDVQLVKEHFNHWEDVAAGALIALTVVLFVLLVYLNRFRDAHYYEGQKLHERSGYLNESHNNSNNYNGYSNEIALEQFNMDKTEEQVSAPNGGANTNGDTNHGSVQNNDLAMRYFQIPRANYRGAPRPLS